MNLADYFHELLVPLRSLPVILTAFLIFVIVGFVVAVSFVNPWMAAGLALLFSVAIIPGLTRYLIQIANWRALDKDIEPPSADMFALLGSFWQVSAILILAVFIAVWVWIDRQLGGGWSGIAVSAFAVLYPAMVAVLVITHSAIQAFNPQALYRLIVNAGEGYWYAPITALAVLALPALIAEWSLFFSAVAFIYLLFAFFAVTGATLRERRLIADVAIHESVEPPLEKQLADLSRHRNSVLTHAYGFASRGNRDGALQHIDDWLQRDPDPDDARQWFFEQMVRWEQADPALVYAQHYVGRLLAQDLQIAAVKVILRARMINERFRPLPNDLPQAIEAAEATGNEALAQALRHG